MNVSSLRILVLHLEFHHWSAARHYAYTAQLAYEEGMEAAGVRPFILTTPWFPRAQTLCAGRTFDQVWLDVGRHDLLDEKLLQWLAEIAPVRVGFLPESFDHLPPTSELRVSREKVERRLPYLTHVLAVDEQDAALINSRRGPRAMWWPQAVPERVICPEPPSPPGPYAVFCGGHSEIRTFFIAHPGLRDLLRHLPSPENGTVYPFLFHGLHIASRELLRFPRAATLPALRAYLGALRWIRRRCFARWLRALQAGCAVVNLPHGLKAYPGRVVEGMAAGRPLLSWEIPDRPRTRALFEDGREILLFSRDDPPQLAAHIERIRRDPAWARTLVENAQRKLRRWHTVEARVRQILHWIESGEEPDYN